ncbi:nucleotide-diphospho-sugar transferase [Dunaliella salina]|uniref:Nucleotide-diphospho-sugar transferase n=1 Tax=Dunaliella salina TaxID=3046 RepID=A0ABQ7G1K3_DUNSA|nr:nucleotide-diphospho-sugar transferase [Dunaliella salina]|eukprot:KAF5828475.1 nucleotide-diphospho-sugar transferase [Dunaliella salina]
MYELWKRNSILQTCVLSLSALVFAAVIMLDVWIHSSSRIVAFSDLALDVGQIGHVDFGSIEGRDLSKLIESNPGLGSTYQHEWAVQLQSNQESTPYLATTDIIFSERINACVSLQNLSALNIDVNVCSKPVGGQTDQSPPVVSFLIPLQNNAKVACTCVCALFETLTEIDGAELIVIDDGSTVDMSPIVFLLNRLRFLFGFRSTLRRLSPSVGFGRALNYGVTYASGKIACFLNADTVVVPGWLHPLVVTFSTFEKAAIVGPMFLGLGNFITEAGGYVYANAQAGNYMRG